MSSTHAAPYAEASSNPPFVAAEVDFRRVFEEEASPGRGVVSLEVSQEGAGGQRKKATWQTITLECVDACWTSRLQTAKLASTNAAKHVDVSSAAGTFRASIHDPYMGAD